MNRDSLVLHPSINYGFSAPVVFRRKAQREGNGGPIVERWNDAAGHHRDARRVSVSASTDRVAPLAHRVAMGCEARLAVNADTLTELAGYKWMEH